MDGDVMDKTKSQAIKSGAHTTFFANVVKSLQLQYPEKFHTLFNLRLK